MACPDVLVLVVGSLIPGDPDHLDPLPKLAIGGHPTIVSSMPCEDGMRRSLAHPTTRIKYLGEGNCRGRWSPNRKHAAIRGHRFEPNASLRQLN